MRTGRGVLSSMTSMMGQPMSSSSVPRPEPFSLDHFRAYCRRLKLDNGRPFVLESFQEQLAADLFAGFPENWWILPEGSGKTTFLAAVALYHGDYTESAMVPIGASSREQAEILYRQAEGFISRTRGLRDRFRAYDGYRRIACKRTGGRIQVYAADDRTGDGIIPSLALIDELHRHRDLRLYRTWRGKLEKRGGQLVTISTAGEPGGEFEDTRDRIKRSATSTSRDGCHVRAAGEDIVIHDWAVPSLAQAEDMDVVAAANPRSDITAERLRKKRESPTMTREHWLRFVCNIATLTGGSAIQSEDWDALSEPGLVIPDGVERWGWLDLGWRIDTTAMGVLAWESDERRLVTGVRVLQPPVSESAVVAGILHTQLDFDANVWVADPNAGAQQMIEMLERGDHPLQTDDEKRAGHGLPPLGEVETAALEFVAHSQDNAPMSQAAVRLEEAIRNGYLRHDGDRLLRAHVLNAVAKSLGGEKWRYDRPVDAKGDRRKNYPIDALSGLLFGHNVACDENAGVGAFGLEVFG